MTAKSTKAVETTSKEFDPFGNDSQSKTVGPDSGLTFENSTEAINVYGDFKIEPKRDPKELDALIDTLQTIRRKMK